uniref:sugar kinase n=1 Tax=Thaumasiovibrio occultus TaxID=1891184 RepID=UPI000B35D19C|nr:sugar kinase [Thaumasiovibrio occultus]
MNTSLYKKFITIGEPMAMFTANEAGDLAHANTFTKRLAGAEMNVAIGMARLGYASTYITKLGQDSFGRYVEASLQAEGIDTSLFTYSSERPTAFQLKSRELHGDDPVVEYFRKNSAASTMAADDYDASVFAQPHHLHLTGVASAVSPSIRGLCHKALDNAKAHGNSVSFDPNLRPTLWASEEEMVREINAIAFKADIVLPGVSEGKILTGSDQPEQIADFYLSQGVAIVVVKLGGEGAYYKTAEGEAGYVAASPVEKVIDTVGAGDSFAVGVVSAWLEALPLAQCVARGCLLGALAVQVLGDSEGLPTRAALNALTA